MVRSLPSLGVAAAFLATVADARTTVAVLEVGKGVHDKHIVIFAARDLAVGEELQYDYQFALGGDKIECHCGAPNCWGRMN